MVKRYDIDDVEETGWNMNEHADGPWVKFEDYSTLESENTRLQAELSGTREKIIAQIQKQLQDIKAEYSEQETAMRYGAKIELRILEKFIQESALKTEG